MEPGNYSRTYNSNQSSTKNVFKWLLIVSLIMTVVFLFKYINISNQNKEREAELAAGAIVNTREPLSSSVVSYVDEWISDDHNWLINQRKVEQALEYFYNETGVQPYLVITEDLVGAGVEPTKEQLGEYAETIYNNLFSDNGHMVYVICEYDYDSVIDYIQIGDAAASVIDMDARDIIYNKVREYYFNDSISTDDFFVKVFKESADQIMGNDIEVPKLSKNNGGLAGLLICGSASIIFFISYIWYVNKEKEIEKLKETNEILNKDIDTSQDSLKEKYKGEI